MVGRRAVGLGIVERDGRWHVHGTVVVKDRSRRVRRSTGLVATRENLVAANELRRQIETEVRDQFLYGIYPSVPFTEAVTTFLKRKKKKLPPAYDVYWFNELKTVFGTRNVNSVPDDEWSAWVDKRTEHMRPASKQHYIYRIMAFLRWCAGRKRRWLTELPVFERDEEEKRPRRRARRVGNLRPELVGLLVEHASPHYGAQVAMHWCTGARVSSLIFGCRLRDYIDTPGKEKIIFRHTKNGEDVEAIVDPWTAQIMSRYLKWRGKLHDRSGPLFISARRQPYKERFITIDGVETTLTGGETRVSFRGMVSRAGRELRRRALTEAAALRHQGHNADARKLWHATQSDLELLDDLTPHWFRHLLATEYVATGDLRSGMEQGGWLHLKSLLSYAHDIPEHRRSIVVARPAPPLPGSDGGGISLTRTPAT